MIVIGILLVLAVGLFLVYALNKLWNVEYPHWRSFQLIAKEAAFTTITKSMRNRDVYDKDGKVYGNVQRRIDDSERQYTAFLEAHADEFGKVLREKGWLNEKNQIKSRKAIKISNDFLEFYYENLEENS